MGERTARDDEKIRVSDIESENNNGSTVAVSNEVLADIHKLCKRDDLKVKAIVNIALKEYLKGRV